MPPKIQTTAVALCDWNDDEVGDDELLDTHAVQKCSKFESRTNKKRVLLLSSLFDHTVCAFQGIVRRGERLTLKSNTSNREWELQTSSGRTKTLPGACFVIPAPDAEALERVNRYTIPIHHALPPLFFYAARAG